MFARDFRAWAREILKGRWAVAGAVCLVGTLLGGGLDLVSGVGGGSRINYEASAEASAAVSDYAWQFGPYTLEPNNAGLLDFIPRDMWAMMVTITIATALLAIVIGGAVTLGMATFNLNLINRRQARFGDLFSQFHRLGTGFCMQFMMGLLVILWSLLFIIPGIIAAYSYAMTPYLMAEFPELRVRDAIRESKRLMRGNKWRLFCLQFSFIGWELLGSLTMGIGYFWINPYRMAAETAFYMDVTGRGQLRHIAQSSNWEF